MRNNYSKSQCHVEELLNHCNLCQSRDDHDNFSLFKFEELEYTVTSWALVTSQWLDGDAGAYHAMQMRLRNPQAAHGLL